MARHLFIVARDKPDLCGYLKRELGDVENVHVFIDRRRGERRQPVQVYEWGRRRGDRRRQPTGEETLTFYGFIIRRQQEGGAPQPNRA